MRNFGRCIWPMAASRPARLGSSMMDGLVDLAAALEARRIDLRSLTDRIDSKGAAGRFRLRQQFEENWAESSHRLASARLAGKVGGRRQSMTHYKLQASAEGAEWWPGFLGDGQRQASAGRLVEWYESLGNSSII